jgi:hypothetical protein
LEIFSIQKNKKKKMATRTTLYPIPGVPAAVKTSETSGTVDRVKDIREVPIKSKRCVDDPTLVPVRDPERFTMTFVLDLDETLVHLARWTFTLYLRPYLNLFLQTLRAHCPKLEVIVWSAGRRDYVDQVLNIIDPDNTLIHHAICRGTSWIYASYSIVTKELALLPGRPHSVLLENSPNVATLTNPREHAIILPSFDPFHREAHLDTTLLWIAQIITRAYLLHSKSPQAVHPSAFITDSPFMTETESLGAPYWRLDVAHRPSVTARVEEFLKK